jgi:hypothetical protein
MEFWGGLNKHSYMALSSLGSTHLCKVWVPVLLAQDAPALTCLSTVIFESLVISAAWFRRSTTWKERRPSDGVSLASHDCPPQLSQVSATSPLPALLTTLTLSEVVMPSMPGPSSCVKNCDATLRRVTLSPLLLAMAAIRIPLKKKGDQYPTYGWVGWTATSIPTKNSAVLPSRGVSAPLPGLCPHLMQKTVPGQRQNPQPHLQSFIYSRLTTNAC